MPRDRPCVSGSLHVEREVYRRLWTVLLFQLGSCVPLSVVFDMAPSQSSLPAASQSSQESRFSGNQDELQRAAEGEGARGKKRELRGWHAPWDTAPIHSLDLVKGRSKVNDMSLEELWAYMAAPTDILRYRTECRSSLCWLRSLSP